MPEDRLARLRLYAPRSGTVVETSEYLTALESSYRHLSAFHSWANEVESGEWRHYFPIPGPWHLALLPEDVGPPEIQLRIAAVQLHSPGFWEFLGALNPLETLRKYLADRHERRKDREWRDAREAEKLMLENERLRTQVVAERVSLLRQAGVPSTIIRRTLMMHVALPLEAIDKFQDSGLIAGVLTEGESGPAGSGRKQPRPVTKPVDHGDSADHG